MRSAIRSRAIIHCTEQSAAVQSVPVPFGRSKEGTSRRFCPLNGTDGGTIPPRETMGSKFIALRGGTFAVESRIFQGGSVGLELGFRDEDQLFFLVCCI